MNFKPFKNRQPKMRRQRRNGAAAIEALFCFPIVILLMFGTLETCSGIFLKESLTVVAYEGCRVGVRRRATFEMVQARCDEILAARNVQNATVAITPSNFGTLDALQPIQVTVTCPMAGNTNFVFNFLANRTANASVSMMREFDD